MKEKSTLYDVNNVIHVAENKLCELHYSVKSIKSFKATWVQFARFISVCDPSKLSMKLFNQFLLVEYGIDLSVHGLKVSATDSIRIRAIRILESIVLGNPLPQKRKRCDSMEFFSFIKPYAETFLSNASSAYQDSSLRQLRKNLRGFDAFILKSSILNLESITHFTIQEYIISLSHCSKKTVASAIGTLRNFLSHLYRNECITTDFSLSFPKVNIRKNSSLPTTYSPDEVERFLQVIDRSSPIGKRDYAMFLLAIRFGMREGEITNLKLEHLKWESNRIEFIQQKTQQLHSLPMIHDIGWAIIDYLNTARPKFSNSCYVFLKHNAPYSKIMTMGERLSRYLKAANIDLTNRERKGMHVFRHTLASQLLNKDVALPSISSILNHSSIESTNIYLKVDLKKLSLCALEVSL